MRIMPRFGGRLPGSVLAMLRLEPGEKVVAWGTEEPGDATQSAVGLLGHGWIPWTLDIDTSIHDGHPGRVPVGHAPRRPRVRAEGGGAADTENEPPIAAVALRSLSTPTTT